MRKKNIIIVCSITILIIVAIILSNLKTVNDDKLVEYLIASNFSKNNDSYLYVKQISDNSLEQYNKKVQSNIDSEYETIYFNIDTYELTKDKMNYSEGIFKSFTPKYSYVNDNMSYTYRVNYNNANIIFEGDYNNVTGKFTCNVTFSYQIDAEDSKEIICNKIYEEVKIFEYDVNTLIEDLKILQYIKKQANN